MSVVVITGASGGIGAALGERLAADGHRVILVARRAEALESVASRCAGRAVTVVADVTRRAEVRRVVQSVATSEGGIDVWVNNVGQGITRMPTALTDEDLEAMLRVNVHAALYGMQEVLPVFRAQGGGQIVNVSSMLGRIPFAVPRTAYSAAKHFLNALTDGFRGELAETDPGVVVSLVSPGVVYTDFGRHALHGGADSRAFPNGQSPEEVAEVIAGVIAGRRPDVYTRAGMRAQVAERYAAVGQDP